MVQDVLVAVGDHRPPPVPAAATDDVHSRRSEGVGVAHHGADVEIVLPVLHADVEREPGAIELLHDGLQPPVAEPVDHVATVTVGQQLRIQARIVRPRAGVRTHAHSGLFGGRVVAHGPGPYRGAVPEVVLLIAHGSRNPAAAADHQGVCATVSEKTGMDVRPAYLEIDRPSIPEAIDAAAEQGATTIRLLPYFLHPGNHVAHDIPQIAADARIRHPRTAVVVEAHVGSDPYLVDLLARRITGG